MAADKSAPAQEKAAPAHTGTVVPVVKWDDSSMNTTYANVCNVTGTREEVSLLFGTNQTLYTGQTGSHGEGEQPHRREPVCGQAAAGPAGRGHQAVESRFGQLNIGVQE